MGKRAPSAPPAPDVNAMAQAQGAANIEAARTTANLNRVNQIDPFTQTRYNDLGGDRWEQVTTVQPYLQNPLNNAIWRLQQDFNLNGLRQVQGVDPRTGGVDPSVGGVSHQVGAVDPNTGAIDRNTGALTDPLVGQQARNQVQDALMARLSPQMERDRDALQTQMRNQGITPGSDAWRAGMEDYTRSQTDARLGVISQAGQELDRERGWAANRSDADRGWALGTSEADRGWANTRSQADRAFALDLGDRDRNWVTNIGDRERSWATALRGMSAEDRQRGLSERLLLRQQPMNELLSLATGQFGPTSGGGGVNVQPTDIMGAYGLNQGAQNSNYQSRVATTNANNQAAAGAVAAVAMAAAVA